ncbi:MAG: endonuclease/exonuclease/phosphatase family protein [Clostridia bacterium]|nr:endonuclease/exonuclease/phosphatase family protein [Clostridia bacterium]
MKKLLKILGILMIILALLVGGFLLFATLMDYQPDPVETITVENGTALTLDKKEFEVLTWNIGYAGLGAKEDFFMDGGTKGRPDSKEAVEMYLEEIKDFIKSNSVDFLFLQEVDRDSTRTYHVDQYKILTDLLSQRDHMFALNYNVPFVPVPWPPIGQVTSGIATYSKYDVFESERYQFKGNYTWPMKTVMLDRCLMTSVIKVSETQNLYLINVHFSAYDDGTLREDQLNFVKDFVKDLYDQGHYVLLGGDWNQTFPNLDLTKFPLENNGELWAPVAIEEDWLMPGWTFGVNDNAPTYRLLNRAYDGKNQTGVIDGFMISPNIELLEVEVVDMAFEASDHNPVYMKIKLK